MLKYRILTLIFLIFFYLQALFLNINDNETIGREIRVTRTSANGARCTWSNCPFSTCDILEKT